MSCVTDESGRVKLPALLASADVLNHAIPTLREIKSALRALHRRGLIRVTKRPILVCAAAAALHHEAFSRRGGLFSILDNTLYVLNS